MNTWYAKELRDNLENIGMWVGLIIAFLIAVSIPILVPISIVCWHWLISTALVIACIIEYCALFYVVVNLLAD